MLIGSAVLSTQQVYMLVFVCVYGVGTVDVYVYSVRMLMQVFLPLCGISADDMDVLYLWMGV